VFTAIIKEILVLWVHNAASKKTVLLQKGKNPEFRKNAELQSGNYSQKQLDIVLLFEYNLINMTMNRKFRQLF